MQSYETRFIIDFMLGRLSRWLRIFGYDALYVNEKNRFNIILNSLKENRIILTRDHKLSSKRAWKLILIKSDNLSQQLQQLIKEQIIKISLENIFSRCIICNEKIEIIIDKESIKTLIPEYVFQTQTNFYRCPKCLKIYWHGTHHELLIKELNNLGIKINENN